MPSLHDSMSSRGEGVPHYFSIFLMEPPSATPEILWSCRPRVFFERGVPDSRTGRAKKPISSASDPSTLSGRLWTGARVASPRLHEAWPVAQRLAVEARHLFVAV